MIRAFNEDKPYNDFMREQIAGDEMPHVTKDSLIATGFLAMYAKVGFREKDNPENRYEYLDDKIATIGRGILGLTVQCARCHDHKFDPIRQPIITGCRLRSSALSRRTIRWYRKKPRRNGSEDRRRQCAD